MKMYKSYTTIYGKHEMSFFVIICFKFVLCHAGRGGYMGIYNEKLWEILEEKTKKEDEGKPKDLQCSPEYLAAIKEICNYAISLAKTIRDMFPLYTLHDETHICNVMRIMINLLGENLERLSRDETAMLFIVACCHDIGMSCSKTQQNDLIQDGERLANYLENHSTAYVKIQEIDDITKLPDDILCDFLRSIHHERINDILLSIEWPEVLYGKVDCRDVIQVCQSHGENAEKISVFNSAMGIDLRMCAIILRLADILDFDTSRAPKAVYYYSGFDNRIDSASRFSKQEWDKHAASHGFFFEHVKDKSIPYDLPYHATCPNLKIEQVINTYIDWVEQEFSLCQGIIRFCNDKWRNISLPRKVIRNIIANGYLSGQFCLTLDQEKVLELLVGNNLYQDPSVFVRELLQNAIDAVRTRQQLDRNLPRNWKPQINIRSWMDEEGYHWFRIEDNGIGMNEEIIKKYFLNVGCSYYTSNDFQQEKYRMQADLGYKPISRYGIGILSCFMGDKSVNQVEISTKHYSSNSESLRMSMHGISGYYYLANKNVCPNPVEMKGVSQEEKRAYRNTPGTSIAVRTNLYQSGQYHSFKEILDKYVVYPLVPIHYEDEKERIDYFTEIDLMEEIHKIQPSNELDKRGVFEFEPTDAQIKELEKAVPGLLFEEKPKLFLKCVALNQYTESQYLSGAVLLTKATYENDICHINFDMEKVPTHIKFNVVKNGSQLGLKMELEFQESFQRRMDFLRSQILEAEERIQGIFENAEQYFEQEIIYGIKNGHHMEPEWYQWLEYQFEKDRIDIEAKVKEIKMDLREKEPKKQDKLVFEKYENLQKEFVLEVCDLDKFSWFTKFFKRRDKRNISIVAHNGVLCGDAKFFLSNRVFDDISEVILLLKDEYRPEVDVARSGVQHLPLELALELGIIRKELKEQGFSVSEGSKSIMVVDQGMTSQKKYIELLKARPDFIKRLYVTTSKGRYNLEEIHEALHKYKKLEIYDSPRLSNKNAYYNSYIYEYCSMAYLRENFTLIGEWNRYRQQISIHLETAQTEVHDMQEFPPTFFLEVDDTMEGVLCSETSYGRCFCNRNHPLSEYIITRQKDMKKMVPGIYQELIFSIAEDDAEEMIPRVNGCLKRLQALPHDELKVSAEAFLKESDFLR